MKNSLTKIFLIPFSLALILNFYLPNMLTSANFLITGTKQFTKNGFLKNSKNFTDLNSQTTADHILITGSNSGIGFAAAKQLYNQGASVHLACRNQSRADEARKQIIENSDPDRCFVHILDVSDLKSVKKFTETLADQKYPITTLVNNAGCMVHGSSPEKRLLDTGYEINSATNLLGTYLLTKYFIENPDLKFHLKKVITVSSGGMYTEKLDANFGMSKDPNQKIIKDATSVYAQNKRQQVVFTEKLAEQYPQINFSSMHPGWADTAAVRTAMPNFYEKYKGSWRTPEMGADTIVYLALKQENFQPEENGKFWFDRAIQADKLSMDFSWSFRASAEAAEKSKLMDNLNAVAQEFG